MWRLIARDRDGREVGRAEIGTSRNEVAIGRDPQSGIQLPSAGVSRRHARVSLDGAQLMISDEGSANGVQVEGQRIYGPTVLRAGMVVQIAEFLIDVETDLPGASTDKWRLLGLGGTVDGRVFEIVSEEAVVGRAPGVHIFLEDDSVSRRHARLRVRPGGLEVEDLGSQNGTWVAGSKLERAQLEPGQEVRFGDVKFVIERGPRSSTAYVGPAAWRRRMLFVGLGAALGGLIVLVSSMRSCRARRSAQAPVRALERLQAEVDEHVERARLAISHHNWAEAADELGQAAARDPLDVDVQKLRVRVAGERAHEAALRDAAAQMALGGADDLARARALYAAIPDDSAYHADAARRIADIDRVLPELVERQARSACSRHDGAARCHAILCAIGTRADDALIRLRRHYSVTCP